MEIKNDAAAFEDTVDGSSLASSAEAENQHELLVAAAQAVIATLRGPIAQQSLPPPALGALRMLAAVLANERIAND